MIRKNFIMSIINPKVQLKNFLLTLLIIVISNSLSFAQSPLPSMSTTNDPGRGMYISDFFVWLGNSNGGVDKNRSVLGVAAHENALFEYCKENHITHIVLYDIAKVLDQENSIINAMVSSTETVADRYCNFLISARTHGISKIGITGSAKEFFGNVVTRPATPPIIITDATERTSRVDSEVDFGKSTRTKKLSIIK
jgi:hypothetical protein